jgi:neutral ceramidase
MMPGGAADDTLLVGVARVDISPPLGLPLLHPLREGPASSIEQPLTATALVVASGERKLAMVACDLIYVRGAYAQGLRERIGSVLGIPFGQVLVNCSHTHAVPPMPGWEDPAKPVDAALARYHSWLVDAIAGAALWANRELRPARMGVGHGRVRIGVNRRERLADGTMILGENPHKPVDEDVVVLRFDRLDGRPLAVVMNYACHPDVLGPQVPFVSPDYVGHARMALETLSGAPSLFLQGAAADIDPITSIVVHPDGREEIRRLGVQLGAEAAKVFADIRTHRRRHERHVHRSMSDGLAMWTYTDVDGPAVSAFGVVNRRLRLPLKPLPSLAEAREEVAGWERALAEARTAGARLADVQLAGRQLDWARLQLRAVEAGEAAMVDMDLQAMRINDVGLVAIPGEPFVEIGLNIKRRSPLAHTMVLGYSNGCLVYIPTAQAFEEGGYEVKAHKNYMLPAGVTPEWAERIETAAVEMLGELQERRN